MKPDNKPDQSFDTIARKFQNNIYGTSKGQLRQILLEEFVMAHTGTTLLSVLDAGGGGGEMSLPLLQAGHTVHLIDLSAELIELAQQRCGAFEQFSAAQCAIQALDDSQYDLVVCHAVMEWLEDPYSVLEGLLNKVKPGGQISLTFFNQDARLFGNILYGNFDYISKGFNVPNRVRMNPTNAQAPSEVLAFVEKHQFCVQHKAGIRCFHDYVRDKRVQTEQFDALLQLERQYAQVEPFMWLGKYFHVIARRLA